MIVEWLGIPAAFVAWGFALYVFVVAPPTRGARYLIAMLVVDGLAVCSSFSNGDYINAFIFDVLGMGPLPFGRIHQASDWALIAIYLPFFGLMLDTPLAAPLKNPLVRNVTLVVGLGIALSMFFLSNEVREQFRVPFYLVISIALSWGFFAAIHAWYIATSEAKREHARAFTFAFGIRDLLWTFTFSWLFVYLSGLPNEPAAAELPEFAYVVQFMYQFAVFLYVPLVAYGVMRLQLFDVDLRIKRSIKRSTIAAAFVATFFIVSELAGSYLSDQLGNVLGVICTGGLVFFFEPIQRAAERLSNAAMPNTHETPEYESYRKIQVYESALQAALEDGHVSERQRRVLNSMIETMGIDAAVAERLENDARMALET